MCQPSNQIARILGDLQTTDNSVAAYRAKLLKRANPPELDAVNQILHIKNEKEIPTLTLAAVETGDSLAEALDALNRRERSFRERGKALLEGAGVSLDHWTAIYKAISTGQDLAMTTTEGQALVERGLLVQTYRLGG